MSSSQNDIKTGSGEVLHMASEKEMNLDTNMCFNYIQLRTFYEDDMLPFFNLNLGG